MDRMPRITYIEYDGTAHEVEVATGMSVMQGAQEHSVPGIVAECGGTCSCATCHIYVDEAWVMKTGQPDVMEEGMLDCVWDRRGNSRLGCQIEISDELDGLIVRLPEMQI